jgi:hypothetical protein
MANCRTMKAITQGTFCVIRGTFRVIQGTFRVIQGTFRVIHGTFRMIQGTFLTILTSTVLCATPHIRRHANCRTMEVITQGTFRVIQGTFRMIQGTFRVIQGTFRVIHGTFRMIQGTFLTILTSTVLCATPHICRHANCRTMEVITQGTFCVIQGTFRMIQGTFRMIQGTFRMILTSTVLCAAPYICRHGQLPHHGGNNHTSINT